MRASKAAVLTLLLAVSAACGRKTQTPPQIEPAAVVEVDAVDQLATFDARVNALAFWSHPHIPFHGLVLAATETGLAAFNIEDGKEVSRIDGIEAKGLALSYTGAGPDAQGYAFVKTGGQHVGFSVFAIDNETRALTALTTPAVETAKDDRGYCLSRDESGRKLLLHIMHKTGWSTSGFVIENGAAKEVERHSARVAGSFLACAADDVDGSFFVIDAIGDIYRVDKRGIIDATPFARSGVSNPAAISIAYNGLVAGGPTEQCCGEIAVLNGEDGSVRLFDIDDGRMLGQATLKASFDVDGVAAATTMALGSGNFGGIYRDGVLALATAGKAPALRLTPLNGLMDALSAPIGPASDARDLGPQAEDDESAPDFAVPDPANP